MQSKNVFIIEIPCDLLRDVRFMRHLVWVRPEAGFHRYVLLPFSFKARHGGADRAADVLGRGNPASRRLVVSIGPL